MFAGLLLTFDCFLELLWCLFRQILAVFSMFLWVSQIPEVRSKIPEVELPSLPIYWCQSLHFLLLFNYSPLNVLWLYFVFLTFRRDFFIEGYKSWQYEWSNFHLLLGNIFLERTLHLPFCFFCDFHPFFLYLWSFLISSFIVISFKFFIIHLWMKWVLCGGICGRTILKKHQDIILDIRNSHDMRSWLVNCLSFFLSLDWHCSQVGVFIFSYFPTSWIDWFYK